ncbi:glycerophosphodiester phosphodiesterase family protein [Kitasatospora sp. GAS204B]|uniref:glycerophosphodiester phosphodiesterase family protein n=1 Tax=unclassified Kitasatospora TaxID=2633591 RepID=UPI002473B4C4|nr:glycerophosphodiester phosphodiesterase family protein [Kitasatospora sp. GAS204B]MDH6119442.1 glycerophosphoryl diester phosphodiesterase [Kitasatospora sp. GAS204B]
MTTPDLWTADPAHTAPAVQVVAHRGSSAALPEHTLAAYRRALAEGADAVECDVRLTRDRQLVCVHDRTIARVSDGGSKVVSTRTLAQLQAYDFGSWKPDADATADGSASGAAADPERRSVLTLESLLELVADCGRRVDLAIETKHPVRYRGAVEAELVRMLRRFGISGAMGGEGDPDRPHARLMSFSGLALGRLRTAAPEFPRVYLFEHPALLRAWPGAGLPAGAVIAGPGIELVRRRPELVTRLRAAGHRVHVWTVDRPEDVALCLELGVSAIITNRPRDVLSQLGR